jgi:hypothetical protein
VLAASEISSARKLFRLGRSIHNLHWIRLIALGEDGGEPSRYVRALRLLAFASNGLWFVCDHSVWLTALIRVARKRPGLADPLLGLNRLCAVLMQGALLALNVRKLSIVLNEIARARAAAARQRASPERSPRLAASLPRAKRDQPASSPLLFRI